MTQPLQPGTPSGFYPDGQGALRLWDGQQWTVVTRPMPQPSQPPTPPQPQPGDPLPQREKKTPKWVKALVIAAIVLGCLMMLSFCGAVLGGLEDPDAAAPATPAAASPTAPAPPTGPPVAKSYASLVELRDAVVAATGYPCPEWRIDDEDTRKAANKYAKESGGCSGDDSFEIYPDAAAVKKEVDQLGKGNGVLLVGPNWTIYLPEQYRERLQAALGGKLVGTEPSSEPDDEPTAKPKPPGIGDKVRDGDYQFTVTKVRCGVSRVGSSYLGEKAQGQFCLVSLRVKNVGDDAIHFSDENQALIDTKGKEYSPDDEAWIYLDSDPYAEINPGNTLKTTVPFDVSKRAKPDYLLLKAGFWGFSEGVRVKL